MSEAVVPVEVRAAAELERRRREREAEERRLSGEYEPYLFADYIREVNAYDKSLLDFEHGPRLVAVLQRLADTFDPLCTVDGVPGGEKWSPAEGGVNWRAIIVAMPPRYFKSETVSRLFSAYFLRRFPKLKVGLASYGAELAWELSEDARANFREAGGVIRNETSAKKRWRTAEGGEMWAAGVGGPILGRGYHLGIIDDPQDPEQAYSDAYRKRWTRWYPGKWHSRQMPSAAKVVVMQRLDAKDAIGHLFEREAESPERWHVVCFDEIKSEAPLWSGNGPMGLPETCTIEPDPREPGEVLAPSLWSPEQVAKMQSGAGIVNDAQRQQRPSAPTGDFWREIDFIPIERSEVPAAIFNRGKDWDTAYTADERNSASAFVESARGPVEPVPEGEKPDPSNFPIYILGAGYAWVEFPELVYWMGGPRPSNPSDKIGELVQQSGPHYVEAKASGKSAAQSLRRARVAVHEVKVDKGDKLARAGSAQPHVTERPRVFVVKDVYEKLLRGERQGLLRVTAEQLAANKGDLDLNDAFVQAIHRHVSGTRWLI